MADTNLFPDEAGFSPRPAWQVIEATRRQYLTGELTLPTNPATRIFLRDGMVYYAERSSDGTLPIRLMMEGVITREQMQRGTVIVNGVEHVGRMFDADPTIDRPSVELCVELFTDDVMMSVANKVITGYQLVLYRRHSSGIDRWYPHSVPVATRPGQTPMDSPTTRVPAVAPVPAEPKAAAEPQAKPEPPAESAPRPAAQPAAQPVVQPAVQPVAQTAAQPQPDRRNTLNAPPITQAVPVTRPVSAVPPPPPITQVMPITEMVMVTPPPAAQAPISAMPAPTTQIPVTQSNMSAEIDASVIAGEVAEAIKRAFAGMGAGL